MLTPEQKIERQKANREAWLAKHPEYYKKGGKGYEAYKSWRAMNPEYFKKGGKGFECNRRLVTCECGQAVTADHLRRHQCSWKHKKLMDAKEAKAVEARPLEK